MTSWSEIICVALIDTTIVLGLQALVEYAGGARQFADDKAAFLDTIGPLTRPFHFISSLHKPTPELEDPLVTRVRDLLHEYGMGGHVYIDAPSPTIIKVTATATAPSVTSSPTADDFVKWLFDSRLFTVSLLWKFTVTIAVLGLLVWIFRTMNKAECNELQAAFAERIRPSNEVMNQLHALVTGNCEEALNRSRVQEDAIDELKKAVQEIYDLLSIQSKILGQQAFGVPTPSDDSSELMSKYTAPSSTSAPTGADTRFTVADYETPSIPSPSPADADPLISAADRKAPFSDHKTASNPSTSLANADPLVSAADRKAPSSNFISAVTPASSSPSSDLSPKDIPEGSIRSKGTGKLVFDSSNKQWHQHCFKMFKELKYTASKAKKTRVGTEWPNPEDSDYGLKFPADGDLIRRSYDPYQLWWDAREKEEDEKKER